VPIHGVHEMDDDGDLWRLDLTGLERNNWGWNGQNRKSGWHSSAGAGTRSGEAPEGVRGGGRRWRAGWIAGAATLWWLCSGEKKEPQGAMHRCLCAGEGAFEKKMGERGPAGGFLQMVPASLSNL
jgi:hypothetical protein